MAEEQVTAEQDAQRLSKNANWLGLFFAFVCINTSVALFVTISVMSADNCLDCKQFSPILLPMLIILAIFLLFLGVSILTPLCLRQARRSITRTPQVVVASIPVGDLEKSPAPILPDNHLPHGKPSFVEGSAIDLPDYFTAVSNIGEVDLSVDVNVCTEGDPEFQPPPCYEQALEMAATLDSLSGGVESTCQSKEIRRSTGRVYMCLCITDESSSPRP